MASTSAAKSAPDPLHDLRSLTPRDQVLLSWLAEHYVLTSSQIATALFPSRRAAQRRLTHLHRLGAVSRFRYHPADVDTFDHRTTAPSTLSAYTGSSDYRYTLGPFGLLLHPTAYTDPDNPQAKPPRSHVERRARIARSRALRHLLGVNEFFVDLCAHTRTHRDTALLRWFSEQHATRAFTSRSSQIRPDAHGVWRAGDSTVAFFLEHDNGTEDLPRVLRKLRQYERLAVDDDGPRYPVLFWVPDRRRQQALLHLMSGVALPIPVAAAVQCDTPAGPVWAMPGLPNAQLPLHQLPSDPVDERT